MVNQILGYLFCFLSGVFCNMSLLHLFAFYETQNHPMIAKSKRPYLASKVWGVVQLAASALLLTLAKFNLGFNGNTLSFLIGFSCWSLLLGVITRRFDKAG